MPFHDGRQALSGRDEPQGVLPASHCGTAHRAAHWVARLM